MIPSFYENFGLNILVVQVRVNALLCLAELVQTLDKAAVIEILQTVQRCTAVDRSAPTLMCTLAIANAILKQVGNMLKFHLHISNFEPLDFSLLYLL